MRDTARRREGWVWHHQAFDLEDGTKSGTWEFRAFNCCHCQRFVLMNPERTRDRHLCHRCNLYTCDSVGCVLDCNPAEESAELAFRNIGSDIPFLQRGPQGEVLYDKEKLRPFKSYRTAPREI